LEGNLAKAEVSHEANKTFAWTSVMNLLITMAKKQIELYVQQD
jgi:hypothetical protein